MLHYNAKKAYFPDGSIPIKGDRIGTDPNPICSNRFKHVRPNRGNWETRFSRIGPHICVRIGTTAKKICPSQIRIMRYSVERIGSPQLIRFGSKCANRFGQIGFSQLHRFGRKCANRFEQIGFPSSHDSDAGVRIDSNKSAHIICADQGATFATGTSLLAGRARVLDVVFRFFSTLRAAYAVAIIG